MVQKCVRYGVNFIMTKPVVGINHACCFQLTSSCEWKKLLRLRKTLEYRKRISRTEKHMGYMGYKRSLAANMEGIESLGPANDNWLRADSNDYCLRARHSDLIIAASIFTHLYEDDMRHYFKETAFSIHTPDEASYFFPALPMRMTGKSWGMSKLCLSIKNIL